MTTRPTRILREALLRRPNGVTILQVALTEGQMPTTLTLPNPGPGGGAHNYTLTSDSPTQAVYTLAA